ncbi:MAG: RdgB/HAM1 family non-canonical purine NTP pyrophosphatase [Lachnospiraceae bacterium]|nr:RdgB/HAM1 family non-canonical purine NTP pyrophosphatase [Lachnospiraceae bacterium]
MEKTQIVFATSNENKLREIRMILKDFDAEVISLKEAGINTEIIEDGRTFEENAVIKATTIMKETGKLTLADDSGLEVDFLNKEPGVYSARYCGVNTSYRIKNRNIIERLTDVPDEERTARFVCVIALAIPESVDIAGAEVDIRSGARVLKVRAAMEGRIGYEEKGENGFGYDPIFYLPEYGCYSAELAPEKKNEISHRGKALRAMRDIMEQYGLIG